ncbi:DUF4468 domain-containing protein [Muribaculum intestinale]|uniref:DUF4468 domain-containing protein n=1 Tax=Muribaculum intestinale TaxID=1796646 RepID=UPI00272C8A30|nr:DUF4468 domain-containing protein [Muribaculum intestinale]
MKFFFKVVLLLCTFFCYSTLSAKDKLPGTPLECDTVIQCPGVDAEQIYNNLRVWFADNMRSSNDVIQLDDSANKHIIGKTNIPLNVNNMTWRCLTGVIRFTIDVAARDGRFRLKMSDFSHESFTNGWTEGIVYVNGPNPNIKGLRKKQNSEMQKRAIPLCIDNMAMIIATMQDVVANKTSVSDGDW